MRSLRLRIFLMVAAVTMLVWSSAAAWTQLSTRSEVQQVLDRRLVEAARMVSSLVGNVQEPIAQDQPFEVLREAGNYSRQLSCQIWTVNGKLVGRSGEAPTTPLALEGTGFSERVVEGETWRVYTLADPERGIRVMVGDNLEVRERLVDDLMTGLLYPSLVGILALALLIWTAVGAGLAPLREITRRLKARDPNDIGPLGMATTSSELTPVVHSIDDLFHRLEQMRANEKHFIASAAHELQTPLAGLRAHAQIALVAEDGKVREQSLRHIQTSVDRTSRLVHQLLELAREEAASERVVAAWVPLQQVVSSVAEGLVTQLQRANVELAPSRRALESEILVEEGALTLALRNLVENALNHSPRGGTIEVDIETGSGTTEIIVCDDGSGIPSEEIEKVKGRFVRGARQKAGGSGLGLSIVELVMARSGARLELANRSAGGLRAALSFPEGCVRLGSDTVSSKT
ncbi:ATP-binding protein [Pelagerythrobacter aerophilus]